MIHTYVPVNTLFVQVHMCVEISIHVCMYVHTYVFSL